MKNGETICKQKKKKTKLLQTASGIKKNRHSNKWKSKKGKKKKSRIWPLWCSKMMIRRRRRPQRVLLSSRCSSQLLVWTNMCSRLEFHFLHNHLNSGEKELTVASYHFDSASNWPFFLLFRKALLCFCKVVAIVAILKSDNAIYSIISPDWRHSQRSELKQFTQPLCTHPCTGHAYN